MLVDIDRIVVGDRIRKDFGDIQELADNIKKNGLLNPLTVNGDYKLLAGERRLKACKLLGWSQVDVRMVESEDEAQDIEIELSENNVRRNFTGSELAEGLRRQMEIEQEKAQQRIDEARRRNGSGKVSMANGTARDKAGEAFGISGKQAEKVLYVADNADMLDPADFAEWDEGKLSTNNAYQRIRAAKEQAERQRDEAREDVKQYEEDVQGLQAEIAALERQNDELYELANNQQVVEREVVKTVAPDDYADMKRRVHELESSNRLYSEDNKSLRKQLEDAQDGVYDHERLMDAARLEADVFRRKYSELSELAAVIAAINKFLNS